MKARISEIFKSIQGEGIYQGKKQVFIRFHGCNLSCTFCDTRLDFFQEMGAEDVAGAVSPFRGYHSIALTGGEPLLQVDFLEELLPVFAKRKERIYLETNGTQPDALARIIHTVDIIAMDFKLPTSGGGPDLFRIHDAFLEHALTKEVFVKAVIGPDTSREDLLKTITILNSKPKRIPLVLQAVYAYKDLLRLKLESFLAICKKHGVGATIGFQLHKETGVP